MKKITYLLLVLGLFIAACGAPETTPAETNTEPTTAEQTAAETEPTEETAEETAEEMTPTDEPTEEPAAEMEPTEEPADEPAEEMEPTEEPAEETEPADEDEAMTDGTADEAEAMTSGTAEGGVFPAQTLEGALDIRPTDHIKGGDDEAIMTIIEYGDFECPACASAHPIIKQLVETYPDQVRVIYRHFPLTDIHGNAQIAAEAAEAAAAQGEFWLFHDALYENQSEFAGAPADETREFLIDAADDLGLDVDQFTAALDDGTYTEYVQTSLQEAANIGLPGTPALIVNGELIQGVPPFEAWAQYVETLESVAMLEEMQYDAPPEMTIDPDGEYYAEVTMENGDSFTIELLPQSAPVTVNNFVFLAREGWFDGVSFHRVLPDFVAQTGDPTGTGMGGPGYQIDNEIDPELSHAEPGMVAMANSGPDTNGSQWYVTLGDAAFLDGSYSIFGRVTEGLDVVQAITPRDPSANPNAPAGDMIGSITITEG